MTSVIEPAVDAPAPDARAERVVIAADDSYGAIAAADWVAERLRHVPGTVEVVVVEGRALRPADRAAGAAKGAGDRVAWRMREYLETRAPGLPTTTRIVGGDAVGAIRQASTDADLLVIGCNRDGFWRHLPIATRSTRVAELAVRPTAVVPARWSAGHGPVVAAVSSGDGDEVLDWAAAEAAASGRELLLVCSDLLPWSPEGSAFPALGLAMLGEADRQLLATCADRATAMHPRLAVRTALEHDALVPVLTAYGARASALVLGTDGGSGPRLGSVLRGVLEHTVCPVVVVPTGPGA
ncbi:MAG: universal stress protein [Acidobacteria bacterium]|nr:universal stress protein [Acidobacteriota bacterium]